MFCKQCGSRIDDDSKFCPSCGYQLAAQPQAQPQEQPQPAVNAAQPAQETVANADKPSKDRLSVWALILASLAALLPLGIIFNKISTSDVLGIVLIVIGALSIVPALIISIISFATCRRKSELTKRLIAICIPIILAVVAVLIPGPSLATYEKNLGTDYDTKILDEDGIEDTAEDLGINLDVYDITGILRAEDEDSECYAYVIQCESKVQAKALVLSLKHKATILNQLYTDDDAKFDVVSDGKFVLFGNKKVVDDALDK